MAWLAQEFQPYRRRVIVMVVVAALAGIGLALVVPAGKRSPSTPHGGGQATTARHALTAPKKK